MPEEFRSGLTWMERISFLLVGAASVYLIFLAVQETGSARTGDILLYLCVAVFFACGIALLVAGKSGRDRVTIDSARLHCRDGELIAEHSLAHRATLVFLMLSGAATGALIFVGYPSEDSVLPMDDGQRLFFAPVAGICCLFMVAYSVLYLARRGSRRLVLSPAGIKVPKVISFESELKWSDLKNVEAEHRTNATGVVRLQSRGRQPAEVVTNRVYAERLSVGAAATYWTIRFYHDHPELRDELSDERAVARLRSYGVVDQEQR
ncbi:hypothetical protein [Nocardia flavorosea]|uniref:hypothetical protein n=2 Tax=Nocardia flavorosea TaxID=53429 RepID=UPI002455F26B|nr:hypothetical protein [Nocardia flavorosea]